MSDFGDDMMIELRAEEDLRAEQRTDGEASLAGASDLVVPVNLVEHIADGKYVADEQSGGPRKWREVPADGELPLLEEINGRENVTGAVKARRQVLPDGTIRWWFEPETPYLGKGVDGMLLHSAGDGYYWDWIHVIGVPA